MAEGRNVLIQWEYCDIYLVQQFALSQSAVFIHKRSSDFCYSRQREYISFTDLVINLIMTTIHSPFSLLKKKE